MLSLVRRLVIQHAPAVALLADRVLHPPRRFNVEALPGVRFPLMIPAGHTLWEQRLSTPCGHEAALCRWFQDHLQSGDVFFDVGTGWGYFSSLVTALQPDATCHLFDPGPRQHAYLKRNIRLDPSRSGWSIHHKFVGAKNDRRCISLDRYAADGDCWPSVVKIDVDGAEADVMRGAVQLVARRQTQFLIELHPRLLADRGESMQTVLDAFPDDFRIAALINIRDGQDEWSDDLACLAQDENPYVHAAPRDNFRSAT